MALTLKRIWGSHALRRRVYELLDDASMHPRGILIHRLLIGLVVASVLCVVLESVPSLSLRFGLLFHAVEILAIIVFTVEYVARLWVSTQHPPHRGLPHWKARFRHVLSPGGMIDLIVILPFYLSFFFNADLRIFVLIRLLRFFKLARYSPATRSIVEAISRERRALGACFVILIGLILLTATMMHLVEGDVQPDKLGTIPDAMYWSVITLGTVGYGDVVPITVLGKLVASFTAMLGLVTFAMPVGIIATAFAEAIQRREFVVTWSMVARVPIFAELNASDIAEIMHYLHSHTADLGDTVFRRGDLAHAMFFVAEGEVEIELEQRVRLGEGQFFGELSVLHNTRRTATARAVTRIKLLVLEASDLRNLMKHNPAIAKALELSTQQRLASAVGDAQPGDLAPEEIAQSHFDGNPRG